MVQGCWSPEWMPVVKAFENNFIQYGEQGAGLALHYKGQLVLDIWAGHRTNRIESIQDAPWSADTLVNVFSAGKGLVSLAVLQLVDRGLLVLDNPVAAYWPAFASHFKESITIRQVLSHQSGLSAFHEKVGDGDIFDWNEIAARIAQETSWWPAGSGQGYSPFIFGWILAELAVRVSGCATFNEYFQKYIALLLGADVHFGVPSSRLGDIADTGPLKRNLDKVTGNQDATSAALGNIMKADPRGVTNRAFTNPLSLMTSTNSLAWRQAQIPAANAHATAGGLARIYGALSHEDSPLLSNVARKLCWEEQTFQQDKVLGLPLRFSHGFMLSRPERPDCRYGRGEFAFGHPGAGGSLGFADPNNQLGFGYVTARMGQSLLIDDRAVALIDAAYDCITRIN